MFTRLVTFSLALVLAVLSSPTFAHSTTAVPISNVGLGSEVSLPISVRNGFYSLPMNTNLCIVLALDTSGSMKEKDNTDLRYVAARMFIALLDVGDRVGLVTFASAARRLTPQMVEIRSPQDKLHLISLLSAQNPAGWTDIQAALDESAGLFEHTKCPLKEIVLLTDGEAELGSPLPIDYESRSSAILRSSGAGFLGIALTTAGETALLSNLAASASGGGRVLPARSSSDLIDAYLEALRTLKDRTLIGSGQKLAPTTIEFLLEPAIAGFLRQTTFIVSSRDEVVIRLIAPDGTELISTDPRLSFAVTDRDYAVFSVKPPAPGIWRIQISGSGPVLVRAILTSRLRIQAISPAAFQPLNQPLLICARVVEETENGGITTIIGSASISALVTRPEGGQEVIDHLVDDGTRGDNLAGDGVFCGLYPRISLAGEYHIEFNGYKDLIPISQNTRTLAVAFPVLALQYPSGPPYEAHGESFHIAAKMVGGDPARLDTGEIVAVIHSPDGKTFEVPMEFNKDVYTTTFPPKISGKYLVSLMPRNARYKGVAYEVTPSYEITVYPFIRFENATTALAVFTTNQLARGWESKLKVTSTSSKNEPVHLSIVGVPGLTARLSPEVVPPGISTIFVTVQGTLPPGEYKAQLILTASAGIDLPVQQLPIQFNIFQPTIMIEVKPFAIPTFEENQLPKPVQITIVVRSNQPVEMTLQAVVLGLKGAVVDISPAVIPQGKSTIVILTLHLPVLTPGKYEARVQLSSSQDVLVSPQVIPLSWTVTPSSFCSRWCFPIGGAAIFLTTVLGFQTVVSARRQRPWGTLRCVRAAAGLPPLSLTIIKARPGLFKSPNFRINGGRNAQLRLDLKLGEAVEIRAVKKPFTEYTGRPPVKITYLRTQLVLMNLGSGLIKVNDLVLKKGQESVPLRTGMHISIAEYEFVFQD